LFRREIAMFETLENNPTLRERVLGLTAIGAVLIGGAAGVDTMLTSGWQIGGDGANAAPVVYADWTSQYQDDVNRDWSTTPPRPVQLAAAQDASLTVDSTEISDGLAGATNGAVTAASYGPPLQQQSVAPQMSNQAPATADDQQNASDRQFEAIENDIRQATEAIAPDTSKDDELSPPPSANDQG
jgi:hypothetical protein